MVVSPTASRVPLRPGDFDTLSQALDYAATGQTGINFYASNGSVKHTMSYAELRQEAIELAHRLVPLAPKNALVGLIADTSPDFVRAFFACQYAGLLPVPMPVPTAMGGKEIYLHQIEQMSATAKVSCLFVPERLLDLLGTLPDTTGLTIYTMESPDLGQRSEKLRPHSKDDLCYIQYSSGSTNDPKGVIGSQKSVVANCHAIIAHGLQVRDGDRAVSWLPLYHDMGLIGFLVAPIMAQLSIDLMAPSDFARRPLTPVPVPKGQPP